MRSLGPEVKLLSGAVHGMIAVSKHNLPKGHLARCPDLAPKVSLLTFIAEPGFTGTDIIVVEVIHSTGETQIFTYPISIG